MLQTPKRRLAHGLCAYAFLAMACASPLCGQNQQDVSPDLAPTGQTAPQLGEPLDNPQTDLSAQQVETQVTDDNWNQPNTLIHRFLPGRLWFDIDILGWATKGVHAPPLATTSPPGTVRAGVL